MRQIDEILRQFLRDGQLISAEPLGSAGGMSGAQFWRITVVRGSPDPAPPLTLILRRWPTESPTPDRLRFIHSVLDHAVRRGVAVIPLPIRTTSGETSVTRDGHLWELAPWMPGAANYELAPSPEKLRAAMTTLAGFHTAVADFWKPTAPGSAEGSNAVKRHYERLRDLTEARVAELNRSIDDTVWPELAPLARQFLAALPGAAPRAASQFVPLLAASLPTQPCLRDIWHDHVLFTGDEVTGIIDFGAVDFDTPATDIARLLGSLSSYSSPLCRDDVWRDGLSAYSTVRPLSPTEGFAARALEASGAILAGCNWIRWTYGDGRQFDDQKQVVERFRRIKLRIESV
jgi:Ser/Thr protein kinase RdoA (MazF antagonist)